ncbi:MAG: serine/threonine protein kinase [Verrucomicrobia bacterium]|nr:MAG: serine/threonine protein kinase [Verrucomicrobiota bacterium]
MPALLLILILILILIPILIGLSYLPRRRTYIPVPIRIQLSRRRFLVLSTLVPLAPGISCALRPGAHRSHSTQPARFFFVSQGKTGLMNAHGSGLRYLDLNVPNQASWQPCATFSDGRRVLLLSMEPRRDGPGRPFDEYYTQTPTHLWVYDLDSGKLEEIATRDRMAVFYTPALLLGDHRMLVQVVRNKVGQIFSMNLDGSDAREFTRAQDGFPYGLSLSPDSQRVAYHLAAGLGYQIWTCDLNGGDRVRVAARPGHIYFGPMWSPDGQWLAYQDCEPARDPGHDWSDICVSRPDGSEQRQLTQGQAMWFGASYGNPENRGGGSNLVAWTRDGAILFPRRLPGSKVAWEFQAQRPDTDHFNRDFKPELARGGTEICRLDPHDGWVKRLTHSDPPVWDFRASESPDARHIVFCRARTGGSPAIWMMDADGRNPRELTRGLEDKGADHPRWLPHGG